MRFLLSFEKKYLADFIKINVSESGSEESMLGSLILLNINIRKKHSNPFGTGIAYSG